MIIFNFITIIIGAIITLVLPIGIYRKKVLTISDNLCFRKAIYTLLFSPISAVFSIIGINIAGLLHGSFMAIGAPTFSHYHGEFIYHVYWLLLPVFFFILGICKLIKAIGLKFKTLLSNKKQ